MTRYVLDASVAARFLLSESLSDKAAALLRDFIDGRVELAAPSIMVYEVGNALWKAARTGTVDWDAAKKKQQRLFDLSIPKVNLEDGDHADTLDLAHTLDATYYDAAYATAASKTGATLLTADNALYRRTAQQQPTLHLKDYTPTG
jgi:predicted nucleic acid-binding protein